MASSSNTPPRVPCCDSHYEADRPGIAPALRRLAGPAVTGLLVLALGGVLHAQSFSFELLLGSAYNIPTPLTVHQAGYPDIHVTAHYDTKPFGPHLPYYSWRVDFWNDVGDAAWEVSEVHHRLFLTNNPPDIQFFAIHFGYNFFLVGRAWKRRGFVYHLDGGILICNPENTVRGIPVATHGTGILGTGYSFGGLGANAAVSRDFPVTKHVFVDLNLAVMAGRASVPVATGSADVPNVGIHGQVGAGVRF